MSDGIKHGDLGVLVPIMIGLVLIIALLSKFMAYIFKIAYAKLFHAIFGIVLASTVMIVPTDFKDFTIIHITISVVLLALGTGLGWWMSRLEDKMHTK